MVVRSFSNTGLFPVNSEKMGSNARKKTNRKRTKVPLDTLFDPVERINTEKKRRKRKKNRSGRSKEKEIGEGKGVRKKGKIGERKDLCCGWLKSPIKASTNWRPTNFENLRKSRSLVVQDGLKSSKREIAKGLDEVGCIGREGPEQNAFLMRSLDSDNVKVGTQLV